MKKKADVTGEGLRAEYDFSQLKEIARGKYAAQYQEGTNLVLLAPDVAEAFPTEESVNEALRLLIRIAKAQVEQLNNHHAG